MIEIITRDIEDTVAVKMSGKLTSSDYEAVVPVLESKIKTHGKINLYCELQNVEAFTPGSTWKDMKFDSRYFREFGKVVMVGDKHWLDWMSKLSRPFVSARVKYFDNSERDEAMEWMIVRQEELVEA